jgi:hypothetical protein
MFSGAQIDHDTLAIFQRSCADCHSDGTAWPWYSKVPPMSWMIENDVGTARARMNLSHWSDYSTVERQAYLSFIAAVVQTKRMPLPRYTRLHPEARLSASEIQTIRLWTTTQRKLLKEQERDK